MTTLRTIFLIAGLVPAVLAAPARRDETVSIFQGRKVAVAVPDGLTFATSTDARGMVSIKIGAEEKISLQLVFLPDPDGMFTTARGRKEFMHDTFRDYVASSVEQAMQFKELEPRVGGGTFCVFTDASLVGKTTLPPGEFHQSTNGLKVWPGVVVIFTLFSQDTTSTEYQSVMTMLRESVREKPGPLI